jgi:2-(1,2-epoxy-1,2-dihydrophenyl)acetyl-CoA isomerase
MPATETILSSRYAGAERDGAIALVTLDREERLNALGVELVADFERVLDAVEAEAEIRAVVLAGAGRAFSAGGDLADVGERVASGEAEPRLDVMRRLQALIVRIRDSPVPFVAVVGGPAYGAGFSTVLACDLVVLARGARLCQVFTRRNLVPDLGSAWLLPRAVGTQRAKEMMLLAGEIDAEEALAMGIANRVAESEEEAHAEGLELARRIASRAPATMTMTKELINRAAATTLEDSLAFERQAQAIALGTPQTLGAMRAFLEKSG